MGRACWIAGLVLIWAGVAVITVGTHLQRQSPRFAEYERGEIAREAGAGGEERLNPAGRMALVLSFTWPFAFFFSGFKASLFSAGVFGIQAFGRWHRKSALLAAGAFGLACLAGAVLGAGEALRCFHWGFATLGVGNMFSALGLAIGGMGVMRTVAVPHHSP